MAIYQFEDSIPVIDDDTFIFDSADIIGAVTLEAQVSIWSHVSIRGDNDTIKIGRGSNIQEGCVLHTDHGYPLTVGENVTVGHQAMLHGCTISENTLIGMQAIVLNGAKIGRNCLIGAGAIIPEGREIPSNSLVIGIGKIVRLLSQEEIEDLVTHARSYIERSRQFRRNLKRVK